MQKILQVKNLTTEFNTAYGMASAIKDVSFDLLSGEILGIVGESGSGKSTISLSILKLIDILYGKISAGEIWFNGKNLLSITENEIQAIRGNNISMIFQDQMTSLNPLLKIGYQIKEPLIYHAHFNKKDAQERAIQLLEQVSIPEPKLRMNEYSHQLSGGMRQRVMIAMALACNPQILIADEPTTALDVTIQFQILDLLKTIQNKTKMSIILITHDLGVVSELCDRVIVLYSGKIVEIGKKQDIFATPKHPYTIGLMNSIPVEENESKEKRLPTIDGIVPPIYAKKQGCPFFDRCKYSEKQCFLSNPELKPDEVNPSRAVACFHPQ